jgi:hypothetical protein
MPRSASQHGIASNFAYIDSLLGGDEMRIQEADEVAERQARLSMTRHERENAALARRVAEFVARGEEEERIADIRRLRQANDIRGFRDPYIGERNPEIIEENKQMFHELQKKAIREEEFNRERYEDDLGFAHLYDSDINHEDSRFQIKTVKVTKTKKRNIMMLLRKLLILMAPYKHHFKPYSSWSFQIVWYIYKELRDKVFDHEASLLKGKEVLINYTVLFAKSADIFKQLMEYDELSKLPKSKISRFTLEENSFDFEGLVLPPDYDSADVVWGEYNSRNINDEDAEPIFNPEFVTRNPVNGNLYYGAVSFSKEFVKIIDAMLHSMRDINFGVKFHLKTGEDW